MKETDNKEKDAPSLLLQRKRTQELVLSEKLKSQWVIASEVAGLTGMAATSARRARDYLDRETANSPELKRQRKGTKATEYHASILPIQAIQDLLDRETELNQCKEEQSSYHIEKKENKEIISQSDFLDEFVLIPGYNIQVSTGNGTLALDERIPTRHLAFRRKWLSFRGFNEKDLVLLWAKGDSMEPTISNNDTIVVNTARTKPVDGNIYVIRHEDNLWAKRVQVQPGAWLLISDNQAVYPPIEIRREDMANFEVIGQVVHISKDVGI